MQDIKHDPDYVATLDLIKLYGVNPVKAYEDLAKYYFKVLQEYKEKEALDIAKKAEEPVSVDVNQVLLKELCQSVKVYDLNAVHAFSQAYQRIHLSFNWNRVC